MPVKDIEALKALCGDSKPGGDPAYRGILPFMGLSEEQLTAINKISTDVSTATGIPLSETDYLIARLVQRNDLEGIKRLCSSADDYRAHMSKRLALNAAVDELGKQIIETVMNNAAALFKYLKRLIPKNK
ncbi:hypothetical protein PV783_11545 [Chitinophaga sp. CC14]|uniref:hypothetical protein n=1 Tax=Chitinophaga sp. CC14 TaxID=3029199 RepID=UPI003B7ADFA4